MTLLPGLFDLTGPEVYESALAHPKKTLATCQLDSYTPERNRLNRPKGRSGAFAVVYHLVGREQGGERHVALRCFVRLAKDAAYRYERISTHLAAHVDGRGSLVRTKYVADGILTKEGPKPITTMPWIDGLTLDEYVQANTDKPHKIARLASSIRRMAAELHRAGIAHGDLQHRNILVTTRGEAVRLIDYDGMYVPGLHGQRSNENGHEDFQHPGRDATHFGPGLDDFSLCVLFLTLKAIERHPDVWDRRADDDGLLFHSADYVHPTTSAMFADLERFPDLHPAVTLLRRTCQRPIGDVPPLERFIRDGALEDAAAAPVPMAVGPAARAVEPPRIAVRPMVRSVVAERRDGLASALGEPVMLMGRFTGMAKDQSGARLQLRSPERVEIRVPGPVQQRFPQGWKALHDAWLAATGILELDSSTVYVEITQPSFLERPSDAEARRRMQTREPAAVVEGTSR